MKKWEYHVVPVKGTNATMISVLNQAGENGFEAVAGVGGYQDNESYYVPRIVMKREMQS